MKHIKLYEEFNANERIMHALGNIAKFVMVLPKAMEYIGFAASAVGKYFNAPLGNKIGEFLVQHGKELEEQYRQKVASAVAPLLKDPSKAAEVAKDLIYSITAKHAGMAFAGTENMYKDPRQTTMKVLGSIDTQNIAADVRKLFPNLVN